MKIKNYIYLFIFSLALATGGAFILSKGFNLLNAVTYTLSVVVFLVISIYALTRLHWDFTTESRYQKTILWLFFLYEAIIVSRGIPTDYNNVKELIQMDYLFWVYLIPIFIFFDKRLITLAYLMNAIYFLAISFFLICLVKPSLILERATAENFIHPFVFGCGFLLLNARYLSKTKKTVAFLAMAVGIFSFVYLARRNGIISYATLILGAAAINARYLSASKLFKIFPIIIGVIVIGLLSTDSMPASFTEKISKRLTEDSRTGIFDFYFDGMKGYEVYGKGMQGQFYYPSGGTGEDGETRDMIFYRKGIENGYLQLNLNGGIIYVVLFALVLLPAVFLGLFRSSNQLSQAAGVVVLSWLIDMGVYGLPRLTTEYVLVWICAGICYKTSLRETPDEEITDFFKNFEEDESTLVY